ncbi:NAD-dependent epimerase/dehydratase family protein [Motilibacter aurantiacus]|uniref:NAD-dependent epimerase/dehydratase family protein n=1 Tax=Motilibacter aurantiacus TaxID=2714955 RepID=UPI00140D72E6|nr:NAD-dependent epimerase/dehydratase family protein [Motilibacter aurantiacus]
MRALVTGASGMLGGAVAAALVARGDEVRTLQRRPSGVEGAQDVRGDITDRATARGALAGVDGVVHLAARVGIVGTEQQFVEANIVGTQVLLDMAREAGVPRLVFVSSPSVAHAGRSLIGVGATPADPEAAHGHYSRTKAAAEQLALAADSPSLAVVAIRPHLVWGPGDTQLVARIVDRARSGRLALVGSGAALIDTTYVDNAAAAMVAALDRADVAHGRPLVVSNGEPRTVAELFERICRAAGVAPPRLHVPFPVAAAGGALVERVWSALRRQDDPPMTRFLAEQLATAHWFDQRRTRELLAWEPQVSLAEGFDRLAAAYA